MPTRFHVSTQQLPYISKDKLTAEIFQVCFDGISQYSFGLTMALIRPHKLN